jgi:medium-chain acyl-[acyl-carrier-protein] hydrolase
MPGRGRRIGERAHAHIDHLVKAVADGLTPALSGKFALFGHSLGGLVAFELARELRRRGGPRPAHHLISSRPAPQLARRLTPLCDLPDSEFLRALHERYGYTAPVDVGPIDELLELMLPTVRSDVRISDLYEYRPEPPLDIPITTFGGITDPTVTRDELAGWQQQTTGPFEQRMLPGGHFYLTSEWRFLVRFVANTLQQTLR